MLTVKRRANKVTLTLTGQDAKSVTVSYAEVDEAKHAILECRFLIAQGRGYTRIENYLTYGREV